MATQSSLHFYLNWAKERIDEMDAALAAFESQAGDVQAGLRARADQTLADLRQKRDDFQGIFEDMAKKQAAANEAQWSSAKAQLDADWSRFDSEVRTYVESFGKQFEEQRAAFTRQADAQLKAWREAADAFQTAAGKLAADRRSDVDATIARMKVDAAAAEERLQKMNRAGTESWSALMGALTETRALFDRANQSVRDAFKKAAA